MEQTVADDNNGRCTTLTAASYFLIADVGADAGPLFVETTILARVDEEQERPFPRHGRPHGADVVRTTVPRHRYAHTQHELVVTSFIARR